MKARRGRRGVGDVGLIKTYTYIADTKKNLLSLDKKTEKHTHFWKWHNCENAHLQENLFLEKS
jgi:hypothetical protein